MRQVWLGLPYLLQVWHILTILAANLATRAQLGAFLAASFRQYQLGVIPAAPSASTKAIKELQVSRAKIKATCITGSFIFRMSLALNRLEP
ncbi:hypothetical protein HMPREF2898_06875 [Atopobium sp. HMSC064B08]|nr:hypothetical protein HMPREF2898_06875 [Atopobium sp. HMSC064B08]